jgi:hypothetical protein
MIGTPEALESQCVYEMSSCDCLYLFNLEVGKVLCHVHQVRI